MNHELRAAALQNELDRALERIAQLEDALGGTLGAPPEFGFTKNETIMFGVLMKREHALKSAFMAALYSDKHEEAAADQKIVDVWICKMRQKLKPFNIEIGTIWGQGYYLPPEAKRKAMEYMPPP